MRKETVVVIERTLHALNQCLRKPAGRVEIDKVRCMELLDGLKKSWIFEVLIFERHVVSTMEPGNLLRGSKAREPGHGGQGGIQHALKPQLSDVSQGRGGRRRPPATYDPCQANFFAAGYGTAQCIE